MAMSAHHLRVRADLVRRLALRYEHLLAHQLATRCGPDTWRGPVAERMANELALLSSRLHLAAAELGRAAAQLERQAAALDAAEATSAWVAPG
jgi:PPE-repeat protein